MGCCCGGEIDVHAVDTHGKTSDSMTVRGECTECERSVKKEISIDEIEPLRQSL